MRSTRVIPVVLLDANRAVKTKQFRDSEYVGDPVNTIRLFSEKSVDELVILDITATPQKTKVDVSLLETLASQAFMPISFGGNVSSLEDARKVFGSGMEKVILGTAVFENIELIEQISSSFGSQAVTVCLDVINVNGDTASFVTGGLVNNHTASISDLTTQLQSVGVGEVIIQSVENDSMLSGFNLEHISAFSSNLSVPVVALGGCGKVSDMKAAIEAGATAIAAGTLFTFVGPHRAVLINYPTENELSQYLP
jgi:cyclase